MATVFSKTIAPQHSMAHVIKNIWVFKNDEPDVQTVLPFFADGFPGLIYYIGEENMYLYPANKAVSSFFVYGQTLQPIELRTKGKFECLIFQLQPDVLLELFGLNAHMFNNDCYDLLPQYNNVVNALECKPDFEARIKDIENFITSKLCAENSSENKVKQAIQLIVESEGKISLKNLQEQINVSERTLQRQFKSRTGITPKQFCKIIQFQASLGQLHSAKYHKLAEVAYDNGFADQSHFIRDFKFYTGNKPSQFKKQ